MKKESSSYRVLVAHVHRLLKLKRKRSKLEPSFVISLKCSTSAPVKVERK